MKNVLLTTTALVVFAGAAAADVSWSGGAGIGHNDDINGGFFYDVNLDVTGTFDLGDGYGASISYGFDLESKADVSTLVGQEMLPVATWGAGNSGLQSDAFPTIEITAPFGSLKGGDLGDKGASEYFYADRDGMHVDVENHDSSTSFDVRALAEFGAFGVAVGAQNLDDGSTTGLNFGAGATLGDITVGLGYDDDKNSAQVTAISADGTFGGVELGVSYASAEGARKDFKIERANVDDTTTATVSQGTQGYDYDETSIALTASMAVSSEVTVGGYVASNKATLGAAGPVFANQDGDAISGTSYGVSLDYASGPVSVGVYYDVVEALGTDAVMVDADKDGYYAASALGEFDVVNTNNSEWGVDFAYEVSADLSVFAGHFDDGTAVSYVGATYAFNDSLTGTVSWAEADEISGPEFKNGTTIMLSASF